MTVGVAEPQRMERRFVDLGLDFDAPVVGFYGRTTRHSMLIDDGVVRILRFEESHGVCELTAGEAMVDAIGELQDD